MILKYFDIEIIHNSKNYVFRNSKMEISDQESIPLSDYEIQCDIDKNICLFYNVLRNMVQAKLYSSEYNAERALKNNTLTAVMNITYIDDLKKCESFKTNPYIMKNPELYNDKVSSIRYTYVYGNPLVSQTMIYGNPSCFDEYENDIKIEYNINKTYAPYIIK